MVQAREVTLLAPAAELAVVVEVVTSRAQPSTSHPVLSPLVSDWVAVVPRLELMPVMAAQARSAVLLRSRLLAAAARAADVVEALGQAAAVVTIRAAIPSPSLETVETVSTVQVVAVVALAAMALTALKIS